jgi:hypothetical protein
MSEAVETANITRRIGTGLKTCVNAKTLGPCASTQQDGYSNLSLGAVLGDQGFVL